MELLMETPPQVEFQGMEPIPESRARVLERIAHIEERYGRITAFRVVVKAPGAHHRTSGHYEVNIHVALPDGRGNRGHADGDSGRALSRPRLRD
jgi:hypothetical protein